MKNVSFSSFLVLFTSIVLANPVYSENPPPKPLQLTATRAATAPVIDGVLDDACWKNAGQADGFSIFEGPASYLKI